MRLTDFCSNWLCRSLTYAAFGSRIFLYTVYIMYIINLTGRQFYWDGQGAGDSLRPVLRVSEPKKKGARSAAKTYLSLSMRVVGQTNAVSVCGRPLVTLRSRTYSSQNYIYSRRSEERGAIERKGDKTRERDRVNKLYVRAQSTYFTVRGQSYFSRLLKYWPPFPLSARRVCPPPATKAGVHTRRAERGMGEPFFGRREK